MRRPPVVAAAAAGHAAMVRLLLERGADPTVRDTDGRTAADVAKEAAFVDVLGELARVRTVFGEERAKTAKARVWVYRGAVDGLDFLLCVINIVGHCCNRGVGGYTAEEVATTVRASTRICTATVGSSFVFPLPAIAAGRRRRTIGRRHPELHAQRTATGVCDVLVLHKQKEKDQQTEKITHLSHNKHTALLGDYHVNTARRRPKIPRSPLTLPSKPIDFYDYG